MTIGKRNTLKASLWRERADYSLNPPRPLCDVCAQALPMDGGCDMHEFLIRRGHVPKRMQDCIWSKFNCVLVHRACHERADGLKDHFRNLQIKRYGGEAIAEWLNSLPFRVEVIL